MKTREQKKEVIQKLVAELPLSSLTVFTSYSREGEKGLSVDQLRQLRRQLKADGGDYLVAKKKLILLALKLTRLANKVVVEKLNGSLGVVFGGTDAGSLTLAKNLYNFSKNNTAFKILGALFAQRYWDERGFKELASLPSREMLVARLLGLFNYPLSGLVSVLQGNLKNLLILLKNIKKE